jgi:hypothetical protein
LTSIVRDATEEQAKRSLTSAGRNAQSLTYGEGVIN